MQKKILSLVSLLGLCAGVPTAFADETVAAASNAAAAGAAGGSGMQSLIMFGALFIMMYFLMIRPQSKRAKEQRNMLASITKGDEVVTQGGLLGTVARDAGSFFIITVGDGVEIPVQKQAVVQLLPKGTLKSI